MTITMAQMENGFMSETTKIKYPHFSNQIIAIVGGFGSGKTEVSVNLAKYLVATQKSKVSIVDLDLVNPYFRSREATEELEALGIRAIAPRGEQHDADLPILLPEVKGAIENPDGFLILDVGGDSQGTTALGSLPLAQRSGMYDMLFVINSRRPATDSVETSLATMDRIERSSKMKFTGLISNSHLIDETDYEIIKEGYDLASKVGKEKSLPLIFISVRENLLGTIGGAIKSPILPLTRSMLKPWERKSR